MSYSSYNQLLKVWSKLSTYTSNMPINLANWGNSNLLPLMNVNSLNDLSLQYLPEPYWGNTGIGDDELHSVVINYNPAAGSGIQHYTHSQNLFGFKTYQEFVHAEVTKKSSNLSETTNWHSKNRAMRVLNTLKRIKVLDVSCEYSIANHLSIELIPWHTKDISQIDSYLFNNLNAVFDDCIKFSANEASRIENEKLKNVVILRMSGDKTIKLLDEFQANKICTYKVISMGKTQSENAKYLTFKIDILPNTQFLSIWNRGFNTFSSNVDMDWIFQNVI